MCGVVGLYGIKDKDSVELSRQLSAMMKVIKHRGPDDEGYYINIDQHIAFGHVRLSIIDIHSGHQPLASADNKLWIVFNGEIYNFKDLRNQLTNKGYRFKSHSDTEVIVYAYAEWGEDCVQHLRGMFAFAIWDVEKNKLFCARDRLGIKPFFYFWDGQHFIFASELKSIHQTHLSLPATFNESAVVEYLRLGYLPFNNTPFKQIAKLPPGHSCTVKDNQLKIRRYWELSPVTNKTMSYTQAKEALRSKIQEAVQIRMMSEVPLGAFLSGGVDSSIVVALMDKNSKLPIPTHCIGFSQQDFDEREYARQIANKFNTDHRESLIDIDISNDLEKIIWHMDEPFADASAIPTYYLCKEIKKSFTVCLSGDGGDELFAGYDWYAEIAKLKQFDNNTPRILRDLFKLLLGGIDQDRRGGTFLKNLGAKRSERHVNLRSCFNDDQIAHILSMDKDAKLQHHPIQALYDQYNDMLDDVMLAQWVDLNTYLCGDILAKVDRMSMAHSLEVRVPLLDHEVVELAFSMNTEFKMQGQNRKKIFKEAFSDLIPSHFFDRTKQGFSVPMRDWLLGNLKTRVEDQLLSYNNESSGLFNRKEIINLWNKFQSQSFNIDLSNHIWALLSFEIWYSQYIFARQQRVS
jgi:asparagine synthase (glutamine-hydrolysing)